jgi:hypothetical protein
MKELSINKINGRIESSPAVNEYKKNSADYDKWQPNWRNKAYTFTHPQMSEGVRLTINGNFIYGAAQTEVDRIAANRQKKYTTFEIDNLHFRLYSWVDINGVILQVYTNFKGLAISQSDYNHYTRQFKIKSNLTYTELDIKDYFINKVLPKYLHKGGIWQRLQTVFNLPKSEVKEKYIQLKANEAQEANAPIDTEKALKARLRKKLNIVVDDYVMVFDKTLIKLLNTHKRQSKRTKATKAPSIMELTEYAEQNSDTDEGMFDAANEYMDDFKDCILF